MTSIAIAAKGYLALCRISNLPSVWTNVLCACLLSTGRFAGEEFIITALSLSCLYVAGMCLNDIFDLGYDRVHRPSRPIPSNAVSLPGALFLAGLLMGGGCALLLEAPHRQGLIAAFVLVGVIICYDFRHKQNPYSVLLMAACRLLIFVVTSLSLTAQLPAPVMLAGAVQFCYVVCLSLVARYENSRTIPFTFPVIPLMLAGIPLLDGAVLALLVDSWWLAAGVGGAVLMLLEQRYVRGD